LNLKGRGKMEKRLIEMISNRLSYTDEVNVDLYILEDFADRIYGNRGYVGDVCKIAEKKLNVAAIPDMLNNKVVFRRKL
jgi:hypothetical protein